MHLHQLVIQDLRAIEHFEMTMEDDAAGWHVILGDNASGKTSIVRAVSLCLVGNEGAQGARQNWSEWIRFGKERASVTADFIPHPGDRWTSGRAVKQPIHTSVEMTRLEQGLYQREAKITYKSTANRADKSIWGDGAGWFSAAFGPFRRFSGGDHEVTRLYFSQPKLAAHITGLGEDAALTEAINWIHELNYRALASGLDEKSILRTVVDFVNNSELLPHGAKIDEINSDSVIVRDGEGSQVRLEELSDGFRSVLAMLFEIFRCLMGNFGMEGFQKLVNAESATVDLYGIILIDEVDAHLHPSWQARIGDWFVKHFPKVQFIVTTHSPIICRASTTGSIWRLTAPGSVPDGGRVSKPEFQRLVFGDILDAFGTELFGEEVTRAPIAKEMLSELAKLNRKSTVEELSPDEKRRMSHLRTIFTKDTF